MTTVLQPTHSADYDVVPGTVYIVDQTSDADGSAHVRLIPKPSQDLRDPLRWSTWRKYYHLSLLVAYSAVIGAITQWESPVYLVLTVVFKTDISTLNVGRALLILMLGIGNVFLTPFSSKFGRRTVYLLSLLVACLAYVWLCFATSAGEFVGAHALLGLAGAPFEALPAISIADIFFAHERGTMTGFYIIGLSLGSFLGPICSGYIFSAQGFRWIYRWGAILLAIMFVIMYFTAEETRFERPVGEEASASTEEALSNREISAMQGLDEKEAHSSHVDMLHEDDTLLSHDSFQLQWKPFRVFSGSIKQYCLQCFQPLLCAWYPAIFWTGISYGSCVAWLAVLGSSSAAIFAAPPYLFSPDDLGLIWIAPLIGSLLGAVYAGPFNDKVTLWLAKRNRGWREPEFRLWAFLPGALILSGGLILYGAGAAAGLPWIGPVFGMGMVGFGLSIGGTVGISFVIDTYKDIHGEAVTTVILIRNIIGFGVTFGIQQWIEGMGLRNCFILIGCLAFVITNFAGVFIKFGKPFRRSTQSAYKTLTRTKAS